LTHLDVSGNSLGQLVLPDGWEANRNGVHYSQHGGDWTTTVPAGSQPLGIIAIANAIPDMGAMTSLNLSENLLGPEGSKHIAEGIKVSKCVGLVVLRHCYVHLTTG
jgi:hypothetical protein